MSALRDVTDESFEREVLEHERPVVVDFWASWCGPCRKVGPELERLADKYAGVIDVVKVNVDANPGLTKAFGIQSIPMIALFRRGQQPRGMLGFKPMEAIEEALGLAELASTCSTSEAVPA